MYLGAVCICLSPIIQIIIIIIIIVAIIIIIILLLILLIIVVIVKVIDMSGATLPAGAALAASAGATKLS